MNSKQKTKKNVLEKIEILKTRKVSKGGGKTELM